MSNIGAIIIARKIIESEIWYSKPAWWLKVWLYIIMTVKHNDANQFKRGQNFFTRDKIYHACSLQNESVKPNSIDNPIRYFAKVGMLTKHQTTRGFIITVNNYDTYQKLSTYKNEVRNEAETKQKRSRNEAITKECKECKNEKKVRAKVKVEEINNFEALFEYWEQNKKGGKYKTPESRLRLLSKLERLSGNNLEYAKEAIFHAVDNNYQSFSNGNEFFYKRNKKQQSTWEKNQEFIEKEKNHV